jgi:hypothetical protein
MDTKWHLHLDFMVKNQKKINDLFKGIEGSRNPHAKIG